MTLQEIYRAVYRAVILSSYYFLSQNPTKHLLPLLKSPNRLLIKCLDKKNTSTSPSTFPLPCRYFVFTKRQKSPTFSTIMNFELSTLSQVNYEL